jgi:cbb3-type cytochrome oxidase maturation protein
VTAIAYLIPIALLLGGVGLIAFFWAVRAGQYDDLDGAAERILMDDDRLSVPLESERDV